MHAKTVSNKGVCGVPACGTRAEKQKLATRQLFNYRGHLLNRPELHDVVLVSDGQAQFKRFFTNCPETCQGGGGCPYVRVCHGADMSHD